MVYLYRNESVMKTLKQLTNPLFILLLAASITTVGCNSNNGDTVPGTTSTAVDNSVSVDDAVSNDAVDTSPLDTFNVDELKDELATLPLDSPSSEESDGLLYMREEEKLARDVYIYMFTQWNLKVFDNISQSEQTHTDAILALLERYSIADPVADNDEGVFEDAYLQTLYDNLIIKGSLSLVGSLYVGAEIEEIDIIDIQNQVDALEGNEDIATVYKNLIEGSKNHLRAFVKNLASQGVDYSPLHLSQDVYDAIIKD